MKKCLFVGFNVKINGIDRRMGKEVIDSPERLDGVEWS